MKTDFKKVARVILLSLIVATVLFIFVQSMLSQEQSKAESDKVGEIVEQVIPPSTSVGGYVQLNLRKIAHFTEFAILGAELALYVLFYLKKLTRGMAIYAIGLLVALTDEGIQALSSRDPSLFDVGLDFCGFAVAATLVFLVWYVFRFVEKRKNVNNN